MRARAVAVRPDSMIEEFLGDALATAGHTEEAFPHFMLSCNLQPNADLCHSNGANFIERLVAKQKARTK